MLARRNIGSRNSGLSSIGERVITEMLTTARVTCESIGASVGTPFRLSGIAADGQGGTSSSRTTIARKRICKHSEEEQCKLLLIV